VQAAWETAREQATATSWAAIALCVDFPAWLSASASEPAALSASGDAAAPEEAAAVFSGGNSYAVTSCLTWVRGRRCCYLARSQLGASTGVGGIDALTTTFPLDAPAVAAAIHPSALFLVALTASGTCVVYDVWSGLLRGSVALSPQPLPFLALDPSGLYLASAEFPSADEAAVGRGSRVGSSGFSDAQLDVHELLTGRRVAALPLAGSARAAAWTADGKHLVVATEHGTASHALPKDIAMNIADMLTRTADAPELWHRVQFRL
jgi:hypothetical protein